jgi:hypothetical protein
MIRLPFDNKATEFVTSGAYFLVFENHICLFSKWKDDSECLGFEKQCQINMLQMDRGCR